MKAEVNTKACFNVLILQLYKKQSKIQPVKVKLLLRTELIIIRF